MEAAVAEDGGRPPDAGGRAADAATASGREHQAPSSPVQAKAADDGFGERAPGSAGGGADELATPPPPAIKSKKRKRKDASGPKGPLPDCRTLIYGAQVRA